MEVTKIWRNFPLSFDKSYSVRGRLRQTFVTFSEDMNISMTSPLRYILPPTFFSLFLELTKKLSHPRPGIMINTIVRRVRAVMYVTED